MEKKALGRKKNTNSSFSLKDENNTIRLIVAICVAAGEMPKLFQLLPQLPANAGISYIIIQQTGTDEQPVWPENLQESTTLPIEYVASNVQVQPNTIYIPGVDAGVSISNGRLSFIFNGDNENRYPQDDYFLIKLAQKCKAFVVSIVLGKSVFFTESIKWIKAGGGIVLAQKGTYYTTKTNVIEAPDVYFEPGKLTASLESVFSKKYFSYLKEGTAENEAEIKSIINFIYSQKGVDLSLYKHAVIGWRILRRMRLSGADTFSAYAELLTHSTEETEILCQELSLNMNSFFQDASAYTALAVHVFPLLLKNRNESDTVRIWCPGCASGEEVISLAICLTEYIKAKDLNVSIQIFATDLNKEVLRQAHSGLYRAEAVQHISPKRLETYFQKVNDGYQVVNSIREMCIFARQHLLKDPPFPRLDLISCQNEMIDFDSDLQHRIFKSFHYSLKPGGFLVLNKSENFTDDTFFTQSSKDHRIYTRNNDVASNIGYRFQSHVLRVETEAGLPVENSLQKQSYKADLEQASEKLLLSRYVPASIVIDRIFNIVRFHGPIYKYLQPSSGRASLNVLSMIHKDLVFELRHMLQQVEKTGKPIRKQHIVLSSAYGNETKASIEITPIESITAEAFYLVVFEDANTLGYTAKNTLQADSSTLKLLLEQELEETRKQAQLLTEELKETREELQAANEEAMANNEELQSINDELKRNKEELQEAIKKMIAANENLVSQNVILSDAANHSTTIIEGIQEPLVLLRTNLSVYTANKAFYTNFRLAPNDVEGQFLYEIANGQWNVPELLVKLSNTVATRKKGVSSFDVSSSESRTLKFNAVFLKGNSKKSDLIMVTIRDITQHRLAREAKEWLAAVVSASNEGIISFTINRTVITWNEGAEIIFGYKESEMICKSLSRVVRQNDKLALYKLIEKVMQGEEVRQREIECVHKNGKTIYVSVSMALMKDGKGGIKGLMASMQDITERKLAEEALRESEERFRPIVNESAVGIGRANFDGKMEFVNQKFCEMMGYTPEEMLTKYIWDITYDGHIKQEMQFFKDLHEKSASFEYEKQLIRKDDSLLWVNISLSTIKDSHGKPAAATAVIIDIDKRKKAEALLRESEERYRPIVSESAVGIIRADFDGKLQFVNQKFCDILNFTADELMHKNIWDLCASTSPDSMKATKQRFSLMEKEGIPFEYEKQLNRKDGPPVWVNINLSAIKNADGVPVSATAVIIDISKRKAAEEELQKAKKG